MKKTKTNEALRQWARGISFTIAMGRRQVFTLISLHISAERKWATGITHGLVGNQHRHMNSFVVSTNCLVDRGLVNAHIWHSEKLRLESHTGCHPVRKFWQLTRAGELVIELLKEAGIYDKVRAELETADRPKLRVG